MGHIAIMAPDHPKRLRAPNQFGKMIVDLSTGEARDEALRDDSCKHRRLRVNPLDCVGKRRDDLGCPYAVAKGRIG